MKFAQFNRRHIVHGFFIAAAATLSACSNLSSDAAATVSEIEVTGQINTDAESQAHGKLAAGLMAAAAESDYSLSCITLTSPAKAYSAVIDANGVFSLKLPANTNVGCFIVDTATQSPVASLYVEAEQRTMGANLSGSLNLSKSADIGQVELDLEKREVRVPKSRIADSENKSNKLFELEDMHASTYTLKCVPTGNAVIDAECLEKLENDNANNTVFFRVLQAMQNGKTIKGLGVWESAQAFQDCGSIDLSATDAAGANENEGISFPYADKVTIGGDFTIDSLLCPLRDQQRSQDTWQNVRKYYALGGVEQSADGYTLHVENEEYSDQNCLIKHQTIVHFSGNNVNKLNGQFYSSTIKYDRAPGGCDQFETQDNHFIIELTKQ